MLRSCIKTQTRMLIYHVVVIILILLQHILSWHKQQKSMFFCSYSLFDEWLFKNIQYKTFLNCHCSKNCLSKYIYNVHIQHKCNFNSGTREMQDKFRDYNMNKAGIKEKKRSNFNSVGNGISWYSRETSF